MNDADYGSNCRIPSAPDTDTGNRPRGRLSHRPRSERGLRVRHTDRLQTHPQRRSHVSEFEYTINLSFKFILYLDY